jgi:MoaD family protein
VVLEGLPQARLNEEKEYTRFAALSELMADITVRYFGMLREIVGKRSEIVAIEDSSSGTDFLDSLSNKHGKKFRDFVFDSDGKIRQGLAFAVNGSSVQKSTLSRTKCKNISEFVILPPISGGSGSKFSTSGTRQT